MPRAMWIPGRDHALVWSGGVAILDASVSLDVVEKMWLLLDDGADLRAFLEGMSAAIGSGLLGLPGFAVGLVRADAMNLAVRGDFFAGVVGAGEPIRIEGTGVTTWSERQVLGGEEITAGRVGVDQARGLILVGGVVPAGLVVWHRSGTPTATPPVEARHGARDHCEPGTPDVGAGARHTAQSRESAAVAVPDNPIPVEDTIDPDREDERAEDPGRFDALFGETLLHSVEQAAIRPAEEKPARPTRVDRVTLVDPEPEDTPDRDREFPATPSFIDAAPRPGGAPPSPPRATPGPNGSARAGDHDGATVARGDVEVPSAPTSDGASDIRASLCPEQHPNPPQSASCRICGRSVGGAVVSIPQPSIGRVHASTGESVDLTGSVIVGRNPRPTRFQGTRIPARLALPFPHISGSHLELRVDGWTLLAVDLNSRNGTYLRRGDSPPQRLRANSPLALYAGDVIEFGDDVTLSFDYLA